MNKLSPKMWFLKTRPQSANCDERIKMHHLVYSLRLAISYTEIVAFIDCIFKQHTA